MKQLSLSFQSLLPEMPIKPRTQALGGSDRISQSRATQNNIIFLQKDLNMDKVLCVSLTSRQTLKEEF